MNQVNRFLFEQADAEWTLRLFEKVLYALTLALFLMMLPSYDVIWGPGAVILDRSYSSHSPPLYLDVLSSWPQLSWLVFTILIGCLVQGLAFRANLAVRLLVFYCVWSLDARAWTVSDGGTNLLHLSLLYLLVFDLPIGSKKRVIINSFVLRLLQFQFCLVYLVALVSKCSGDLWMAGSALYYVVQVDKFRSETLLSLFELAPIFVPILTYSTIGLQFLLVVGLWMRRFKWLVMAAGILLHLGIASTMGLASFSLIMISHYFLFVRQAEGIGRVGRRVQLGVSYGLS